MKILICGDGFVGSGIQKLSTQHSEHQVSFSVPEFKRPSSLELHKDLSSMKSQLAEFEPDLLVNVSGPIDISASFSDEESYLEEPVRQVQAHLRAIAGVNLHTRYLFLSSGAVYGSTSPEGAQEEGLLNPLSPYAKGKLAAERTIKEAVASGEFPNPAVVLRAFSLYSPNLRARILDRIFSLAIAEAEAELFGTGAEVRDFVQLDTLWSCLNVFLKELHPKEFQVFNLSSGVGLSINSLVEIAKTSLGDKLNFPRISFNGKTRMGDPMCMVGRCEKLSAYLGEAIPDPINGVRRYFEMRIS